MAHEKVYSAEFQEAVAYSLACVHQQSLTLKEKQEEEHFHLYNDQDVFACVQRAVGIHFDSTELFLWKSNVTTSPSNVGRL
ncbi:hypothetical protein EMCRGX_G033434 [Ephydatia muelleri]